MLHREAELYTDCGTDETRFRPKKARGSNTIESYSRVTLSLAGIVISCPRRVLAEPTLRIFAFGQPRAKPARPTAALAPNAVPRAGRIVVTVDALPLSNDGCYG